MRVYSRKWYNANVYICAWAQTDLTRLGGFKSISLLGCICHPKMQFHVCVLSSQGQFEPALAQFKEVQQAAEKQAASLMQAEVFRW